MRHGRPPRGGHGCASPGITEGVPTDTSAEAFASRGVEAAAGVELHLVHLVVFLRELRGGAVKLRLELKHLLLARSLAALRFVARLLRALQLAAHLLQHARLRLDGELALLHRGGFGGFRRLKRPRRIRRLRARALRFQALRLGGGLQAAHLGAE